MHSPMTPVEQTRTWSGSAPSRPAARAAASCASSSAGVETVCQPSPAWLPGALQVAIYFNVVAFGLALAWVYSAPPVRLKRNGWWGNAAVALCYEGLPWFTGAAVMAGIAGGDLAPRDVVARGIFQALQRGRTVYLDTRGVLGAAMPTRFPTVAGLCAAAGIELRVPPLSLCTDNGAMIAAVGARLVAEGHAPSDLGIAADSTLPVTTVQV